jgi:hypothetical protein
MYETLVTALRKVDEYDRGYAKLMYDAADAIEELQKQRDEWESHAALAESFAQGWIPVTERLPEEYVDVLCYYEYYRYGEYNCMFRTIDRGYYGNGIWGGEAGQGHKNKVLAWMPLPEPPKEET